MRTNNFILFYLLRSVFRHKRLLLIGAAIWAALSYYGVPPTMDKYLQQFTGYFSDVEIPTGIKQIWTQREEQATYEVDEEKLLIQGTKKGVAEQLLYRKAYVVSYNKTTRNPNWVSWHLTAAHTDGDIPRQQAFFEDEEVPFPKALLSDYRGSGYDRGHMCPAGDNKWDKQAMYESFYLTNMCPQNTELNSGLWNRFEQDCRYWAKKYSDIYIVCGPIYLNQEHKHIGASRVIVPEAFFKVVLCLNNNPRGFGIIVRNSGGQRKNDLYYYSIDDIERVTGIDFFPGLPDELEKSIEQSAVWE